ncbi:hypothetical protein Hanom_Chr01g00018501 [Helianthus anomalus]
MSTAEDVVTVEEVIRGHQFTAKWDAQYPAQGQTPADAPPGNITLYADFFREGNFRLPATHFLGDIVQYYAFHITQLSPMGMVRIRHIEFVCRSQGEEPTKILINPPKSFHDWKMKFFYIHGEVIPMAMQFRDMGSIPKEDLKIPRDAAWYEKLMVLPNQAFGEHVLVAAGMSDRWLHDSGNVSVLLLEAQGKSLCFITSFFKKFLKIISSNANSLFFNAEVALYHRAFPTHAGVMGVRLLCAGEEYWSEQIRSNFTYDKAELFAAPLVVTEGAHISNPRPCKAITPAEKEVVYLSSEESVASSEHELNPPHDILASVLRNLGIDHEDKKPKRVSKKKMMVAEGVAHKKPEVTSVAFNVASCKV